MGRENVKITETEINLGGRREEYRDKKGIKQTDAVRNEGIKTIIFL
jgi:hypothetical protein